MTDQIQPAPTGRAKCRGCARPIAKGELRFGESLPNPYAEGEALHWFHLACAACMRSEKFLVALDAAPEVADATRLRALAEATVAHPRLSRLSSAERAPSGRAHCRLCRELIEKGHWRLSLQMFEEGRMSPMGSIHVECAEAYFGSADIIDRVALLTPSLTDAERADFASALAVQRPAPPDAPEEETTTGASSAPGLAKAGEGDTASEPARRPRYGP